MLVLSRRAGERVFVGDRMVVSVEEIRGGRVKLGFECPAQVPIYREEVYRQIQEAGWASPTPDFVLIEDIRNRYEPYLAAP
jgi:carbon storage regulator